MQGSATQSSPQRFFHMPRFQTNFQKPVAYYNSHQYRQHSQQIQAIEFDGKRLRKAVARKTVDYNSAVVKYIENRVWQRDYRDRRCIQPDNGYYTEMVPPLSMVDNPINAVTTKFVRTSTNKMRCPIFCVAWTPEGRRLVTGASSGEFTLWNGLTFNFETILQAHDSPVRCMVWSHSDVWMVTGDHSGYVKYWQSNMNNVKMFEAHKEPLRGIRWASVVRENQDSFVAVGEVISFSQQLTYWYYSQLFMMLNVILVNVYISIVRIYSIKFHIFRIRICI